LLRLTCLVCFSSLMMQFYKTPGGSDAAAAAAATAPASWNSISAATALSVDGLRDFARRMAAPAVAHWGADDDGNGDGGGSGSDGGSGLQAATAHRRVVFVLAPGDGASGERSSALERFQQWCRSATAAGSVADAALAVAVARRRPRSSALPHPYWSDGAR
jgi:hypothetical protein